MPPTVLDSSAAVSSGQCTIVSVLNGATDVGDLIAPATVAVVTNGTHGNATPVGDGTVNYCSTPGDPSPTDSFTFTVNSKNANLLSNVGTVTMNISFNTCSAGSGNGLNGGSTGNLGQCSLHQEIVLPVSSGQIVLSQNGGLPVDVLGTSFCTGGVTPGLTLNGNEQNACGAVSPLTVTNATGLDNGWLLTGETSDFVDPATPGLTCDTTLTYNNHCIPGGNLEWVPASAVAHNIVPGDTALVTTGAPVLAALPNGILPTPSANPVLQGALVQANPVAEPAPAAGLHDLPQPMCSTAAGQAGGTFVCGAGLVLQVPASTADPLPPGYVATLTLTLS
jgi:hypothetical protein